MPKKPTHPVGIIRAIHSSRELRRFLLRNGCTIGETLQYGEWTIFRSTNLSYEVCRAGCKSQRFSTRRANGAPALVDEIVAFVSE